MRKTLLRVCILTFLILFVYSYGCHRAGTWLTKRDVPEHSDVMVLLMGSLPDRVLEAADLYHKGKAVRMLMVYESMGSYKELQSRGVMIMSSTQQAHNAAVALGVPSDRIIILPGDARSTLDEALAVRKYIEKNPAADTLLLVSSPTHMRRAGMIFKTTLKNMPGEIYIGCSPSSYSAFNPEKWWRNKEDIQAVIYELVKIASFQLFEKKQLKKRIKTDKIILLPAIAPV